jgi:hypothetical protein
MAPSDVRNWFGLYVLCLTAFLAGYSFLAPDSILPLEPADRNASFEIILPFLVAQISAAYRFFTDPKQDDHENPLDLPGWVVKAPPVLVTLLLGI